MRCQSSPFLLLHRLCRSGQSQTTNFRREVRPFIHSGKDLMLGHSQIERSSRKVRPHMDSGRQASPRDPPMWNLCRERSSFRQFVKCIGATYTEHLEGCETNH